MVWIGCLRCEKFRCNFVAWTFAFIALVRPDLHRVSRSNEMVPNAPKYYETPGHELRVQLYGSGAFIAKKIWHGFVARSFALIALVGPDLHRVLCSNEMVQMHSKHYETHKNMCLGCNGLDRVPSLRKIPTRLRSTNFCINCTSSTWFAPSFIQ